MNGEFASAVLGLGLLNASDAYRAVVALVVFGCHLSVCLARHPLLGTAGQAVPRSEQQHVPHVRPAPELNAHACWVGTPRACSQKKLAKP